MKEHLTDELDEQSPAHQWASGKAELPIVPGRKKLHPLNGHMTLRIFLVYWLLVCTAEAATWEIIPAPNGTASVSWHTLPVVLMKPNAWGKDWDWVGVDIKEENGKLSGAIEEFDTTLSGTLSRDGAGRLRWQLDLDVKRDLLDIIGIGFQFYFNRDAPGLENVAPELLDDNRGWRWTVQPGQHIEVKLDKPAAGVYFKSERKKKRVRMMLLGSSVRAGRHSFSFTMTLPAGGTVATSINDRYGPSEPGEWPEDLLAWDASPVDLRFLNDGNRPAGIKGRIRADGDRLVFEDGSVGRFWGVNLQAHALFSTATENIVPQAKRMAQLGINLVRIHHHDSRWVGRNIFGDYDTISSTRSINQESISKLDQWIEALKQEGIYIWLDIHVSRYLKKGDDIDHYTELSKATDKRGLVSLKGYPYLNDSMTARMQEFTEQYLTHVNTLSGLAYKDDPAVVAILISNENDVTFHYSNVFLDDHDVPQHTKLFEADRRDFSKRSGVNFDATYETWKAGPAKIYLNDLEHRWNLRMLAQLEALGIRVPIATTSLWGNGPALSLPALSDSAIMDIHTYGSDEELDFDPRYRASSLTQAALGALAGKPVSISEWNVDPFPGRDRFWMPIFVAAIGSLQKWDAPILYGYSQHSLKKPRRAQNWSSFNDPAVMGVMPVAALIFRRGDVRPAEQTYCLSIPRDALFDQVITGESSATIRTLMERHRLVITLPAVSELPWLKAGVCPQGAQVVSALNQDFLSAGEDFVVSDTGQIRRDWIAGIQSIDTPRSQVAVGWLGGKQIALSDTNIEIETRKSLVAVQSLTTAPIATSERILLTVMAQVTPRDKDNTPYRSQPVVGRLSIRAPPGLKLHPLSAQGERMEALSTSYQDGRYGIELSAVTATHWYELGK